MPFICLKNCLYLLNIYLNNLNVRILIDEFVFTRHKRIKQEIVQQRFTLECTMYQNFCSQLSLQSTELVAFFFDSLK